MARLSGPARVPKAILEARGSTLASSREDMPTIEGKPEPPSILLPKAKPYWDELLALIHESVLAKQDSLILAETANAMLFYHQLAKQAVGKQLLLKSHTGSMYPNPVFASLNRAHDKVFNCLCKLGLNPSDRSNVAAAPEANKGRIGKFVAVA